MRSGCPRHTCVRTAAGRRIYRGHGTLAHAVPWSSQVGNRGMRRSLLVRNLGDIFVGDAGDAWRARGSERDSRLEEVDYVFDVEA